MKDQVTAFTSKTSSLLLGNTNEILQMLQKIQQMQRLKVDKMVDLTGELRKLRAQLDEDLVDLKEIQQEMRSMDRIDSLAISLETLIPLTALPLKSTK